MNLVSRIHLMLFGWICTGCYHIFATVSPCTENRTDLCIQNLATFINLEKPRFASGAELEKLCRDAEDGQRCSSELLRSSSCINPEDQLQISLQIGRSQAVSQLLCSTGGYITDPAFRKLYMKYASCIDDYQKKIRDCYASAGMIEDPELEVVRNSSMSSYERQTNFCCPVVQYVECSEIAIEATCGMEAKVVAKKVMLKAAGKQLEEFCTRLDAEFPDSPSACINCGISQVLSDAKLFISYSTIFLLFVVYYC